MPLTYAELEAQTTEIQASKDRPPPMYPGLGGLGVVPNGPVLRARGD